MATEIWINLSETARRLGVSRSVALAMVRANLLQGRKLERGEWIIYARDVERLQEVQRCITTTSTSM